MEMEPSDAGWSLESARLFSIDVAMLALRRLWDSLEVRERQELSDALQEARRLVVDGHDEQLGYLQTALESHLIRSPLRGVWLTALNALLPSPFRAAEATLETVMPVNLEDVSGPFRDMLRERLQARLVEGMLLFEANLFATV